MDFIPTNLPIEDEYPKLVRDNIPSIIEHKTGSRPPQRVLSNDAEFLEYLLKKMVEESTELQNSVRQGNMKEELADVMELFQNILALQNIGMDEISAIQEEKRQKNGGFKKRILMLSKKS
jgi:predicted house-cleaning noncanonical NTP pyrophosphatase (MazG superfamily)